MQFRLRVKIMLAFFVLIVLSCSVLGYISYHKASVALRSAIEEKLQNMVESTADNVNSSIEDTAKMLEMSSHSSDFILAAASGDGNVAGSVAKKLKAADDELIEDVWVARADGQIVASATGSSANVKDLTYFNQAMGGKAAISEVILSKVTGKAVIIIVKPLLLNGKPVGVLAANINFEKLAKSVAELKAGDEGYGYMLDKQGLTVYHPDKSKILKENISESKDEQLAALGKAMLSGSAGRMVYSYNGSEKLVAYAPAGNFIVALSDPVDEYMAPAKSILADSMIIEFLAIIIALGIAYFVSGMIVKPIERLRDLMMAAGNGDLTVVSAYQANDEIGDLSQSFDTMITSQRNIVREVRAGSAGLANAADEMASSSQEVTAASEEVAGRMQVLANEAENGQSAMSQAKELLEHTVNLIEGAKSKAELATTGSRATYLAAQDGRTKVNDAVNSMVDIKTQTETASSIITELSEYSQQISKIIDTITAIADQTNLLALNAAIEAARAGEQGRGFAVVAEEVRKLAEESNVGAKEIMALVVKVTDKTAQAVEEMSHSITKVETGVVTVGEAGEALDRILGAVQDTVAEIQGISKVITEEVIDATKITECIDSVAGIIKTVANHADEVLAGSQQQASAMQSIAASSEETSASAASLKNMVETFKV
ncbi:MAG: methyl-accepting chemotaxis sensory transducer with Cache sensor [Firmicutes bacterium]|nr:methyl-accepting chemotaxis sensory transducer with Cache sensor [Bacillota bacterium]